MAQIVASVFAESPAQVLAAARLAAMDGADWLELRLDAWPEVHDLPTLLRSVPLPVLVACRRPEDGGQFRGTNADRRALLSAAIGAGAQGLDLEVDEPWSPPLGGTRLRLMIRSFHSLTGVPRQLDEIVARLRAFPSTVAKLVVTAHDLADAAPIQKLLAATDQNLHPTVAFAMGRTAWPTRILAALYGAPLVYGSVAGQRSTAPGQLPVALLAGLYRVATLNARTELYGLFGNPALQSLGPWLHNRVFRRLGRDAVYLPFETARPHEVLGMLPGDRLRGWSVTAPFKEVLAEACQRLAPSAEATGVVNTTVGENHGMRAGHNTDVAGVVAALQGAGVGTGGGRLGAVLGTGGAARAGAVALRELGFAVAMLGRTPERVAAFAAATGVQVAEFSASCLRRLDPAVILQATPLGSRGSDETNRPLPDYRFTPGTVVLDMVYQPRWTRFLVDARREGAVPVPGAAMFLEQARAQVRLFTGAELPVATLRELLAGSAVGDAAPPP